MTGFEERLFLGREERVVKILVTGFDPFGAERINPAWEAVCLLPNCIAGAEIVRKQLPTIFGECAIQAWQEIEKCNPDVVLCVGQAGGRASITAEKVAINLAQAPIPDNAGIQPQDEPIAPQGPAAYFSTLPVKDMVENCSRQGIPAHLSYSAGTFVCNALFYSLLHRAALERPTLRAGFVHVPYDMAQAAGKPAGTPSMPVDAIARGLDLMLQAIAGNEQFLQRTEGELC